MQYYDHWPTDSNEMDIEGELIKLKKAVQADKEYIVMAKSIGTLLALMSVAHYDLTPTKCVFFGMPLDLAADELFKDDWSALSDFAVPSLAFHNQDDPVASCQFTADKLAELNVSVIAFTKLPGNTHNYTEFADYEPAIKHFLYG